MITTDWEGKEDDGRTRFGRKARLWFAHALRASFTEETDDHKRVIQDDDLDEFVAWYCEDPERYVEWQPEDTYRGRRFAAGGWAINNGIVNADYDQAREEIERARLRAIDAAHISSLDDWLRADIAGTLQFPGCRGGTWGWDQSPEVQSSLAAAARLRRRNWPRRCRGCGESFKADHHKARRCPTCRAEGRTVQSKRARS